MGKRKEIESSMLGKTNIRRRGSMDSKVQLIYLVRSSRSDYYNENIDNKLNPIEKFTILSILLFGIFLSSLSIVNAVECNQTIGVFPFVNSTCTVSANLTLNTGTYYLNGTGTGSSGGAIVLNGNNLILDGNGSTIIGNYSSSGIFQFSTPRVNVTIKNFIIMNYQRGISIRHGLNNNLLNINISNYTVFGIVAGNQTNFTLMNNRIISNESSSTIGLSIDTYANNYSIFNNYFFNNFEAIYLGVNVNSTYISNNFLNYSNFGIFADTNSSDNTILNNTFYNNTVGSRLNTGRNNIVRFNIFNIYNNTGILLNNQSNTFVDNNTFLGSQLNSTNNFGISLSNAISNQIINNYLSNSYYGIFVSTNSPNNNISYNTIINTTRFGVQAMGISTRQNSSNTIIDHNLIYNTGWNGLDLDSNFNTVTNNIIQSSQHNGIDMYSGNGYGVSSGSGSYVFNNYINNTMGSGILLVNSNSTYIFNNTIENTNISNYPIVIEGNNSFTYNNSINSNILNIGGYSLFLSSNDTLIYNNQFNNFSQGIIKSRGFYLDSSNSSFVFNSSNTINSDLINIDYLNSRVNPYIEIYRSKNYYMHNNDTQNFTGTKFYSGISSFIFYSNGSVACSDLPNCNGNINITLAPNNYSYVLDNFNLTEGVSRQFSPIWFSSSSTTSKVLVSNLTQAINATLIGNTDCSLLTSVGVTGPGGFSATYTNGQYTCVDETITLTTRFGGSGNTFLTLNLNSQSVEAGTSVCGNFISGLGQLGSKVTSIFIILGVVFALGVLGVAIAVFKADKINFDPMMVVYIFGGLMLFIVIVLIMMVASGVVCQAFSFS